MQARPNVQEGLPPNKDALGAATCQEFCWDRYGGASSRRLAFSQKRRIGKQAGDEAFVPGGQRRRQWPLPGGRSGGQGSYMKGTKALHPPWGPCHGVCSTPGCSLSAGDPAVSLDPPSSAETLHIALFSDEILQLRKLSACPYYIAINWHSWDANQDFKNFWSPSPLHRLLSTHGEPRVMWSLIRCVF